jgi:hypothetical protein
MMCSAISNRLQKRPGAIDQVSAAKSSPFEFIPGHFAAQTGIRREDKDRASLT